MDSCTREVCSEHQLIKEHTDQIPGIVSNLLHISGKVNSIHDALVGTVQSPGWLSRYENTEKKVSHLYRIGWACLGIFFTGAAGYIWTLILK